MADVKISELPALTSPDGAEELVVNDGGTTKKITIANATSASLAKAGGTMTGRLGIGAAPAATVSLDVTAASASSNNVFIRARNTATNEDAGFIIDGNVSGAQKEYKIGVNTAVASADLTHSGPAGYRWLTGGAERMRIDSVGDLLVGSSTSGGGNKIYSNAGVNGAPATSGTTQTAGALRLRGGNNAVLDFGLNGVNTWIQATDLANLANGYNLSLNPNGGNVGIGVVPEDWNANYTALRLGTRTALYNTTAGNAETTVLSNNYVNSSSEQHIQTGPASFYQQYNGTHAFQVIPSAAAGAAVSITNAMTIKNNTNIIIPSNTHAVVGVAEALNINCFRDGSGNDFGIFLSGNNSAGTHTSIRFYNNVNGVCGSITHGATSTAYNTSSDHRLKTDVQPMTGATATFMQLKPCNFEWIADGTRVDGFLAHELGEVIPAAATGTHNGMIDEEYEVTPATGDVYTAAIAEVATESQVMETAETGSYVNLAGETIVETTEQGVTTDLVETVIQRQDVDGVSTEVEVEVTTKVPTMETVITTPAVDEIIHSADVEQPETLKEGQAWRETTAQVMATRSVPDYQGIDQSKVVPLITATIQELIARIEALEA